MKRAFLLMANAYHRPQTRSPIFNVARYGNAAAIKSSERVGFIRLQVKQDDMRVAFDGTLFSEVVMMRRWKQ